MYPFISGSLFFKYKTTDNQHTGKDCGRKEGAADSWFLLQSPPGLFVCWLARDQRRRWEGGTLEFGTV